MKKHLFFMAAGVMALAACTSEDVVDVSATQGNAIGFENVVNKASRADGDAVSGDLATGVNFDKFLVYGYYTHNGSFTPIQIFNGVPVTAVKGEDNKISGWTYDETRYWLPEHRYYFYAYSCADIELDNTKGEPTFDLTADTPTLMINNYLCDDTHQHDLVTASNTNSGNGILALETQNPLVALGFKHALCKAKVKFTTDFPKDYKVVVENVYISSFDNKANFDVKAQAWDGYVHSDNSKVTLTLPADKNYLMTSDAEDNITTSEAFLIPKEYKSDESVKLHFTLKIYKVDKDAEGKEVATWLIDRKMVGTWAPQWVNGNRYQYDITLTGKNSGIEPIVFAAEQSIEAGGEWGGTTQVSMTFGVETGNN